MKSGPERLRRWNAKWKHDSVPTRAFATAVVRGRTAQFAGEDWEKTAQRIARHLVRNNALCISNINIGSHGQWPTTNITVLYLIAWRKKGPASAAVDAADLNSAIVDLLNDDFIDDNVAREARVIANVHDAIEHSIVEFEDEEEDD